MSKRCHAVKKTGEPCKNYAIEGLNVCRYHGGATKRSRAKAARLLEQSAMPAVAALRGILMDETTKPELRLKAAVSLLDRIPGFGKNSHVAMENPVLEATFKAIFKPANTAQVENIDVGELPVLDARGNDELFIDRADPDEETLAAARGRVVLPSIDKANVDDLEGPDPILESELREAIPEIVPSRLKGAAPTVRKPVRVDPPRRY